LRKKGEGRKPTEERRKRTEGRRSRKSGRFKMGGRAQDQSERRVGWFKSGENRSEEAQMVESEGRRWKQHG
jgi:hypothetical protein